MNTFKMLFNMLFNFSSVTTSVRRTQKSWRFTTYVVDMVVKAVLLIVFFKTGTTLINLVIHRLI